MTVLTRYFYVLVVGSSLLLSLPAQASDKDDAIATCLSSWGKHPFGATPKYKTLATSVKVFGIGGDDPKDTEITDDPALVLVNPGVNIMGSSRYELLNPNGWYCFRTSTSVMGNITINAHCNAHIASTTSAVGVAGTSDQGTSVMGAIKINRVDCK